MDNPMLMMLVTVTIFSLMFTIGVGHSFHELTFLWRRPKLLARSLLAVIVMVPVAVGLLVWVFDLTIAVSTGLAVLAAAPGAPLTYKRSLMAGGDPVYTVSLQLTLALAAVVITPFSLSIFCSLFELGLRGISPIKVARQVAVVTFLPVITGLIVQRLMPRLADMIAKPLRILADTLFIALLVALMILLILSPETRIALNPGGTSIFAIITMASVSLAIGHSLGGTSPGQRSSLAIASVARNVGLALFIAGQVDHGLSFVPTLLTYLISGALIAAPYSIWRMRQMPAFAKSVGP